MDSRTGTPAAPILILLPAPLAPLGAAGVAREPDGERMILGLSLIRRAVLAARRAGYGQVFVLSANGDATAGAAEAPSWSRVAATSSSDQAAPLIIAPAAILAETDWLERLAEARIEPAAWAAIPNRIVMVAAASASGALDALDEKGGARDRTRSRAGSSAGSARPRRSRSGSIRWSSRRRRTSAKPSGG